MNYFFVQFFIYTKKGEIQFDEDYCFDVSLNTPGAKIELWKCHGFGGNQKFVHRAANVSVHFKMLPS